MILVNSHGFIFLRKNPVSFKYFAIFSNLLNTNSIRIFLVQSNWGGEYENLMSFFKKIGIEHHVSYPHAHQQNGSAEHKHRHIVEVGLALLANASMPLKFWDEAFLTATYLINIFLLKSLIMKHLWNVSFTKHQIMHLFAFLAVLASPIFDLSTNKNLLFGLSNVLSFATAPCTMV
jgi:hypothetical protein